jgi:hypothetical protein
VNLLRQLVIITDRFLPVFQIPEILARIQILGSVPEKADLDPYKNVRIFVDIEVQGNSKIFLALSNIYFRQKKVPESS